MTENRPRIVIYDSSGKRYASTPEKWTEACEAQMNEKAIAGDKGETAKHV
jgi:hypothetical protein